MNEAQTPTLTECLEQSPWRRLWAMALVHDIPHWPRPAKPELLRHLQEHCSQLTTWKRTVPKLSDQEVKALQTLVNTGGHLPRWPFERRFGPIRPYRPWSDDSVRAPWQSPCSPAERLWYLGVIHPWPARPAPGVMQELVIPRDLLPLLMAHLPLASGDICPEDGGTTPHDLRWDVAMLLGFLHSQEIRPRHGHWLPLHALRDLNARLSVPEELAGVRTERKVPRLSFVHYLIEAAGLIELVGEHLKLTLLAWHWLDAPLQQQYRRLWDAWTAQSATAEDLWRHFWLPGHDMPAPLSLRDRLLCHLAQLNSAAWTALSDFVQRVQLQDAELALLVPWREESAQPVLEGMLRGPLTWWGVLVWEEEESAAISPRFRLSALGTWLLGQSHTPPPDPAPRPVALHRDGSLEIAPPARLRQVVSIASFAEHVRGPTANGAAWFQLSPDSVARAVSRGVKVEALTEDLREALGGQLSSAWAQRLQRWAAAGQAFRLHRLTVLEAADRRCLEEVISQRALRECLGRPLSPRMVTVDENHLPRLLDHLRRLGYWPQGWLSPGNGATKMRAREPTMAGMVGLWLAGRVYGEMARFIRLPAPPPHEALHELQKQLSPAAHRAAEAALSQTLERLAQALDGWTAYAPAQVEVDSAAWLAIIQQAVQEGRDLDIVYWTAGRQERTQRRVTPFWVEWRGKVPYLIAYCHQRQAERVFRVDRIEKMRPADEGDTSTVEP